MNMGYCITVAQYESISEKDLLQPIVFTKNNCSLQKQAISLNVMLAKELIKYNEVDRSTHIAECLLQLVQTLPKNSIIKDFDVLFNPAYAIDVLQILVLTCKQCNFKVIWPGTYKDGKLVYAEANSVDYKVYKIDDYDITCVIEEGWN